jgi:hypothetical protein
MKSPIKIYLEKPDFYDVNRDTWWDITDKVIKWFQWIGFLAVLQVAYDKTKSTSIWIVWLISACLVFRATLAFFQVAIRIEFKGVEKGRWQYYTLSGIVTLAVMSVFYYLVRNFTNDIFYAFVDNLHAH